MSDIAIISLAGRLPNGLDIIPFWNLLLKGGHTITNVDPSELIGTIHEPFLKNPHYVFKKSAMKDIELFDANYFGISDLEAELIDPQHRLFLTCCLEVLNKAGHPYPEKEGLKTGVYAGCAISNYLIFNLLQSNKTNKLNGMQLLTATGQDFISTRVSYCLNLNGSSMTIQTGCSSSLVAVHQACQALQSGELDLALAGGAKIDTLAGRLGYLYVPEGALSSDGFCRPFDSRADGMIAGEGVGVVALCRLDDALSRYDNIIAIIKGTAINNNGNSSTTFSSPSIIGQTEVIKKAFINAQVTPDKINFVEAHGTGTTLGDPIEVQGLINAFGQTNRKKYCALGSVKSNIGHLDTASGVIGLIKVALALHYKILPKTINFTEINPFLELEDTPFYICDKTIDFSNEDRIYAGISSFGFGGTNSHLILSSFSPANYSQPIKGKQKNIFLWSSRTENNLIQYVKEVSDTAKNNNLDYKNVAYTLAKGRRVYDYRTYYVGDNIPDDISSKALIIKNNTVYPPLLVFLFPGQGSNLVNVAEQLYNTHEKFNSIIKQYSNLFKNHLKGVNISEILFPSKDNYQQASEKLKHTQFSQPALFILSVALSIVLEEFGLQPNLMVGHSLGELVSAFKSGLFNEEDIAQLIAKRATLMENTEEGNMLAISGTKSSLSQIIKEVFKEIDIAAYNSNNQIVLSGRIKTTNKIHHELNIKGVHVNKLSVSKAFHSELMDPILNLWNDSFHSIKWGKINIPFTSNLTGEIIKKTDQNLVANSNYWVSHIRKPVKFVDCIQNVIKQAAATKKELYFIEIGNNLILGKFVKNIMPTAKVYSLADNHGKISETSIINLLGKVWTLGYPIDFSNKVPIGKIEDLPIAALNPKRFWINPDKQKELNLLKEDKALFDKDEENNKVTTENQSDLFNEIKNKLIQIFSDGFKIPIASVSDHFNFFDHQGQSLLATSLAIKIRKEFLIDIPLDIIYDIPEIGKLAELIGKKIKAKDEKPLETIKK